MIKLSEAIYPTISTIASTNVRRRFLLLLSVAYDTEHTDPQPEGPCRFHIEIFLLLSLSQSTNLYPVGEVGWEGRRAGGG